MGIFQIIFSCGVLRECRYKMRLVNLWFWYVAHNIYEVSNSHYSLWIRKPLTFLFGTIIGKRYFSKIENKSKRWQQGCSLLISKIIVKQKIDSTHDSWNKPSKCLWSNHHLNEKHKLLQGDSLHLWSAFRQGVLWVGAWRETILGNNRIMLWHLD